ARLAETRALAWGALTLDDVVRPLPLVLGALAVAAVVDRAPMSAGARLALWWLPAMIVVTALDRFAAEPLGLYWLPADRVVDGAWMALVVAGGVGAARLARRLEAVPFMPRVALAPAERGRAIVHGTFTHPSPIAALVYRGDADDEPITELTERHDGHTLFGEPLDSLVPSQFNERAERLGIVAVVALDDDVNQL